jgi:peptidoglycan-N-acetylglucosamine deacetylase
MFKYTCQLAALSALILSPVAASAQAHAVAMTVDDLPFATPNSIGNADAKEAREINARILRAFARHHIPATGFVIEQNVENLGKPAGKLILQEWTRPGFDLGNHMFSHPDVNSMTLAQTEEEISRGEATIAPLLAQAGKHPEFLRFPYNHTGDTREKHDAIAAFMLASGYHLAPCTIDNSDYEFNDAYVLALALHDESTAARVRKAYLEYSGAEIDWYTRLNHDVLGYDPPHIMLLHDSLLNADTIDQVLNLFQKRGYHFVTLQEALRSPAYAIPETFITKYGPMWGYRWAEELGVKVSGRDEPDPPAWIAEYRKQNLAKH